jgi:protein-disulfide isomerase
MQTSRVVHSEAMSDDSNPDGPRSARERLQDQRRQEKASAKRLRWLKIGGVLIFLAGVGALIGVNLGVGKGTQRTARPVSTGVGDAPVTLTVWEDFRCPACGQFEKTFRDTINSLRKEGKLDVDYQLVTPIDDTRGGTGSQEAADAALCAHKVNHFVAYHDVLYKNQPPEDQDKFADRDYLIKLAGKVPALSSVEFEKCVRSDEEAGRVKKMVQGFHTVGYDSTPTVLLDGEKIYPAPDGGRLTPQRLRQMVESKQ